MGVRFEERRMTKMGPEGGAGMGTLEKPGSLGKGSPPGSAPIGAEELSPDPV